MDAFARILSAAFASFVFYHSELGERNKCVCSSGGSDRDMNKNAYSSHSHIIESFQISGLNGGGKRGRGGENKRPTIKHMDNCTTREKRRKMRQILY